MPYVRCREYDYDGKPVRPGGCPKGKSCNFVHPDNTRDWARAPPPFSKMHPFSERGRGRGRGGSPNLSRERNTSNATGSNTIGRGGGSGSNTGGDSGWGSREGTASSGWGGASGGEADKGEGSSTVETSWAKAWGATDSSSKDKDASKDKGKGKATEPSWVWGQMDTDNDDNGRNWGNAGSDNAEVSGWDASSPKATETKSGWGASSPKATETKFSGWGASSPKIPDTKFSGKGDPEPGEVQETARAKRSASILSDERRTSDTSAPTSFPKKAKPEDIKILPVDHVGKMDVDSPRNSIPPPSATFPTTIKPFNAGQIFLSRRQLTPDVSTTSSRSGSVVPVDSSPRKIRSLRSVSHKEGKDIWSRYLEHIRRPIILKLHLIEERTRYKDYKAAQNSPIYVKVGNRGTTILDESICELRARLDRAERDYKYAVDKLCTFEEGFDFPIRVLAGRKVDMKKMRHELEYLRAYVKVAKSCVDNMRVTADDIESRARAATVPVATATAFVKVEQQVTPLESTSRKEELEKQLRALEEKAAEFSNAFLDTRNISIANTTIQQRLDAIKTSLQEQVETDSEGFSEHVDRLTEDFASLGRDLDELCSDIAGLFTSFKEISLAAEQEINRLRASLEGDRQLLAINEANAQTCQELLVQSTESIALLRQELPTFEESRRSGSSNPSAPESTPAPTAIPEKLLDELVAALLPVIRERLYSDIDAALQNMTSSAEGIVKDHSKEQVQALSETLAPVYKVSSDIHAKIDFKSHRLTASSRPSTPHFNDARTGVPA